MASQTKKAEIGFAFNFIRSFTKLMILFAADYLWVSLKEAVELVEGTPISDLNKEKSITLMPRDG